MNRREAIRKYINENSERWKQLAESRPTRLVNVLRLAAPTTRNSLDTHMDMYPAMQALRGIINTGGAQWTRLIRSGITESLCHLLAEIPSLGYCDDPEEDTTMMSSWFPALETLRMGADALKSDRSSAATKQFTATIKKNWIMITTRIWGDPQWSLFPQNCSERSMFATFVNIMTHLDASIISTIDRETDLTVTLLARYWPFCTSESDFMPTAYILSILVQAAPSSPIAEYRGSRPAPPSVIPRILRAFNGLTSALLTELGNMLPMLNRTQAGLLVATLCDIVASDLGQKPEPSATFFKPLLRDKAFWKKIILMLANLDAKNKFVPPPLALLPDGTQNPECEVEVAVYRALWDHASCHAFLLFTAALRIAHQQFASEASTFLKILVRADLFDVLDEVAPKMKDSASFIAAVGSFFGELGNMQRKDPSLRSILRPQFPRPRTLRALLDAAHGPNTDDAAQPLSNFTFIITKDNINAGRATAKGWMQMHTIQSTIITHKRCSRRGCRDSVKATCKGCSVAGYCGTECQKVDWNEHRVLCGFQAITVSDPTTFAYLTYPTRFLDAAHPAIPASSLADTPLPALITSRDLSDYARGLRLRNSETETKVNRLRDERRQLNDADMRLSRDLEERRQQLHEEQTLTEQAKDHIEVEVDAEFTRERTALREKVANLLEEEEEVIRWASWVWDCVNSHTPVMQMMFEERARADRGWS